ncbi:DUF3785 family protein [Clostridium paridis]|uniref:DUF3785 family protein n=1 Tax=Clostridium paridis TaxID=2803863 RepID=A0A937FCQ5_9CLOT|nr:DUF3785 family protein [Clostridium paridis]MBL4930754.1 DUF3785 family protein [Clostridium paridis]
MYKFAYEGKNYEIKEDNCEYFFIDEEKTIKNFNLQDIFKLINEAEEVNFDKGYYLESCSKCQGNKDAQEKYFEYLEYHFYVFTKNGEYVSSSISKDYEPNSFGRLLRLGKFDDSFMVSVIICKNCGDCTIEVEQCDM